MKSLINSIYQATEGEGVNIGRPQIFIRYQGCAIGCINCDSKQTWSFSEKNSISNDIIVEKVKNISSSIRWISITGGDPLHPQHQKSVEDLIILLKNNDYKVNIEASGVNIVESLFNLVDFISWDIKLPSTNVRCNFSLTTKMIGQYADKLQIKAVVQDAEDYQVLLKIYQSNLDKNFEQWVITPAFCPEETSIKQRFIEINSLNEQSGNCFRVIGQQHKWIYGPMKSDV